MAEPTRFSSDTPIKNLTTQKVEYNISQHRKFIKDRSIHTLWERAYLCPCMNKSSGSANSSCQRCHGRGWAYLPAKPANMIIQGQEKGVTNTDLGLYDSGTAIGTNDFDARMAFRDRITVPDVKIGQSLIYSITESRQKRGIFLTYDVDTIDFITSMERELIEGKDYTFDKHSNKLFPDASLIGEVISLNVSVTLRYIVIDLLKESRYQYTTLNRTDPKFEQLPQKLLLKREDTIVLPEPFVLDADTETRVELVNDPKRKPRQQGGFYEGMFD